MAKIDRVITNTQTSLRPSVGGLTPDAQAGNAAQAQRLAALGQLPATPGGSQATSKAPNLLETLQLDDQQRQFSTAAPQQTPSQASIDLLQTGLTGPQLDFTIGGDRGVRVEGGQIVGGPRLDSTGKVEIANRAVQKQFEPIEQQLRESQAGETASNRAALAKLGVLPGAVKGASASTQRLKDVEQQQFRETDELGRAKQRAFDAVTSNIASREASIAQGLLEQAKARIASGVEEFKGQISLLQDIVQREEVVRKAEQLDARENIRILAEGGKFSLQNLSDEEVNELSVSTGFSPFMLNAFVDANRPKAEQIDWDKRVIGNTLVWSGIDPVTQQLKVIQEEVELPPEVNAGDFENFTDKEGTLWFINPGTKEVFNVGTPGQFAGTGEGRKTSVQEVMGEDGKFHKILIDTQTGETISDLGVSSEVKTQITTKQVDGVEHDVLINSQTGEVISDLGISELETSGLTDDQIKIAKDLRSEFIKASSTFIDMRDASNRIIASGSDPSAAGDLALIFNYMKLLDPSSVVREGEFANARNSGSVPNRTWALYNNILKGERLSQPQRKDFLDRSKKLFDAAESQQQKLRDTYAGLADNLNVPTNLVVIDQTITDSITPLQELDISPEANDALLKVYGSQENVDAFLETQGIKKKSSFLNNFGEVTAFGSDLWEHGLDVDLAKGDPVPSPISGKVTFVGNNGGFGLQVKVKAKDGKEFWLSHLDSVGVKKGQTIKQGQLIGKGGNTGRTIPGIGGDGSHLDITVKDKKGSFVSPKEIFNLLA